MVCMLRVGADGWKLDGEELRECTSSLTDTWVWSKYMNGVTISSNRVMPF